jgi:hypothetical protein
MYSVREPRVVGHVQLSMVKYRDDTPESNRSRKLKGREKRLRYVQGTRAYTHAMTNSMARRAAEKGRQLESDEPRSTKKS